MSSATSDHYVTALKRFGGWMVKPGKLIETNPFADLEKLYDESDLRKRRRALNNSDFAKLITATRLSRTAFRGLSGYDRSIVYTLAAYTGLRANEISSLSADSFVIEEPPVVVVEPAYTKNSELAEIPLRSDLLENYLSETCPIVRVRTVSGQSSGKIWSGTWSEDAAEMIRVDLIEASIPYTESTGRDYDLHSLRHQFITALSRAGVSLRAAQELARYSKPELTANIYPHLTVQDTVGDVEKLPPIPASNLAKRKFG